MERCIDISKHQSSYSPAVCKAAGVSTVICRLAYGAGLDTKLAVYAPATLTAGMKLGGYGFGTWHYKDICHGDLETARQVMRSQVGYWISYAKKYGCNTWVAIDQELERNETMGLSRGDNTALLIEAAELIKAAGFAPCLYASASWIMANVNLDLFTYPLWVAYYRWYGTPHTFDSCPETFPSNTGTYGRWMTQYKDRICLWQFTSEGYADLYGCTHGSNGLDKNWLYFQPSDNDYIGAENKIENAGSNTVANENYLPRYIGASGSIVAALKSVGVNSSYDYRKKIATANNIVNYTGTPMQNIQMLNKLKDGNLISPDEVPEGPAEETSKYFPRCTYTGVSIIGALKSINVDSSFVYRSKIAKANNISFYVGTPAQNTKMLNLLKEGKLIRPDAMSVYYVKCSYAGVSIVAALNSINVDSTYANREKIATANGIANYTGTPAQNTQMLNLLKQGKLKKA